MTDPQQLLDTCGTDPGFICESLLDWTSNEAVAKLGDFFVAKPLKILLIMAGTWLISRLVRKGIRRFTDDLKGERVRSAMGKVRNRTGMGLLQTSDVPSMRSAQRAETIGTVLKSMSTFVIYGFASLIILGEMGINLGPLIAGAGIVGVALGFGAQSLVRDFLSGIFMLIEDQFGVGDIVDLGDASGEVEAVTLRVTKLRDVYGTVWHVPNGEIHRVANKSQRWARAVLDVGVAYGTDLRRASEVIGEVAQQMADDDEWKSQFLEAPEVVGVQDLGADAVAIRVWAKVVPREQWRIERELRQRLKDRLDAEGIEIPFPQRTVWVRTET